MKPILLTLLALTTAVLADKTCTPSFDYCAKTLIDSKGSFLSFPSVSAIYYIIS